MNSHLLTGYWVECDNMTEGVDGALKAEPRASVLKVNLVGATAAKSWQDWRDTVDGPVEVDGGARSALSTS